MSNFEEKFTDGNYIFRYRKASNNDILALEKNRLYFSTPQNFNDPYDNRIYADTKKIKNNVRNNIEGNMDQYLEDFRLIDPIAGSIAYALWNSNQGKGMITGFQSHVGETVNLVKESVRANAKVICFSEVYNAMLMWSHYANDHKGFLLVFSKKQIKEAECFSLEGVEIANKVRLEKVDYVTEQMDLSEDVEDYVRYEMMPTMGDVEKRNGKIGQTKLRMFVSQKSKEWEEEREWRLMPRTIDLQEPSPLGFIKCVPAALVLGTYCDKKDSERIIAIAKNTGIPMFRMVLDDSDPTFKLKVIDI